MEVGGGEVTLAHGTYTPSSTNYDNIYSLTEIRGMYSRVGNIVTVSVFAIIKALTANTITYITIGLPIASDIADNYDLFGGGALLEYSGAGAVRVTAEWSANAARVGFMPKTTNSNFITCTFQYIVK